MLVGTTPVVLDDVNDRKLPDHRHVHRLVAASDAPNATRVNAAGKVARSVICMLCVACDVDRLVAASNAPTSCAQETTITD